MCARNFQFDIRRYIPFLQNLLKRELAPKHLKKTSSSIRSFLRLLLSKLLREKNPPSIATSVSPPSPFFLIRSLVVKVQQDQERERERIVESGEKKKRKRERKSERTRNGNAGDQRSATSFCDGPATRSAYTRACTHSAHPHIGVHYACTSPRRCALREDASQTYR